MRRRSSARRAHEDTAVDLNLVSLIDVFTILIFFLLASAGPAELFSAPRGVTLPRAAAGDAPQPGLELAVAGDRVLLKGREVATLDDAGLAALGTALRAQAVPGQALVLVADRELPYRTVGALMRQAAAAGIERVSFALRQEEP
ncbi:MAG: biopolymer transporter ExbD [Sphaerotilus natans]